ncbi:hypothetical protein ACHAPJ_007377 [Fusarium lateritium]
MAQIPPKEESPECTPSSTGSRYKVDMCDKIHYSGVVGIHAYMGTLFCKERFADMMIICGGHTFHAHRAIVCTQSPFFDKALSNNWKEATLRIIELPDDDPYVVRCFLEFLYKGNYCDGVNCDWGRPSLVAMLDPETVQRNLQNPAGVEQGTIPYHQLPAPAEDKAESVDGDYMPPDEEEEPGEEYNELCGITVPEGNEKQDLSQEAAQKMERLSLLPKAEGIKQLASLRDDMALPLRLYVMADKFDVFALRLLARDRFYRAAELVWEEAESFPDMVDELYQTTPPGETAMRDIVCRLVGARILNPQVRDKMRPVMAKHGDFAVGVLEYAIHLGTLS